MKTMIANHLLEIGAVTLRPNDPFTWSSGIKSPIYCDNQLTMSFPNVRRDVAGGLRDLIVEHFPSVEMIAGTATGGIAPAAWVSDLMNLPMCYVRGAAKGHGKGKQVEGLVKSGQKVVVIEDLISTGGSSIVTVEALRSEGCEVLGIVSIFSYELSVSKTRFEELGVKAISLTTSRALSVVAAGKGYISNDDLQKLEQWRSNPEDDTWRSA